MRLALLTYLIFLLSCVIRSPATTPVAPSQIPELRRADLLLAEAKFLEAYDVLDTSEKTSGNPLKLARMHEAKATVLSFMGDYAGALREFDRYDQLSGFRPLTFKSLADNVTALDAQSEVLKLAKVADVLLINEAHHVPMHRAFIATLLPKLIGLGYRYYAAETLYDDDSKLVERGYPVAGTGYYTRESVFANLLRSAMKLKFNIVPYEAYPSCDPFKLAPQLCQNQREEGQADHLVSRIFARDPGAKVIVHAGYGHIQKVGDGAWIPMAQYLSEKLGQSRRVVSIDQTLFSPRSTSKFEPEVYLRAESRFGMVKPYVLSSREGPWIPVELANQYDLLIFHPRPRIRDGRPDWLSGLQHRSLRAVPSGLCLDSKMCLVEARIFSEPPEAIPVDRVIKRPSESPSLVVPRNANVIITNRTSSR